jgi:hypothetical protein
VKQYEHNIPLLTTIFIFNFINNVQQFIINIQYIINSVNQQCTINNHRNIVHQNLHENPNGRKQKNVFVIYQIIHSLEAPTSQFSSYNGRRLQPHIYRLQPKGSYNSLIYQLQLEGGTNPLAYRLQPEGSSNSLCFPPPTGWRL